MNTRDTLLAYSEWLDSQGLVVSDAAGLDLRPLLNYWARGEGRAKWADSPTPYRTLVALLSKYVGPGVVKGLAAHIFHIAFGYWPGDRKGSNPIGPG